MQFEKWAFEYLKAEKVGPDHESGLFAQFTDALSKDEFPDPLQPELYLSQLEGVGPGAWYLWPKGTPGVIVITKTVLEHWSDLYRPYAFRFLRDKVCATQKGSKELKKFTDDLIGAVAVWPGPMPGTGQRKIAGTTMGEVLKFLLKAPKFHQKARRVMASESDSNSMASFQWMISEIYLEAKDLRTVALRFLEFKKVQVHNFPPIV